MERPLIPVIGNETMSVVHYVHPVAYNTSETRRRHDMRKNGASKNANCKIKRLSVCARWRDYAWSTQCSHADASLGNANNETITGALEILRCDQVGSAEARSAKRAERIRHVGDGRVESGQEAMV